MPNSMLIVGRPWAACWIMVLGLLWASGLPGLAMADDSMPRPVPLVFDTDLGNDVDDAMALSVIHALESREECRLLAVTLTKDNPYCAAFVDLYNTFYGRGDVPIGAVRDGATPEDYKYIRPVATAEDNGQLRYPYDLLSGRDAPEAVGLLRKVLAGQPDRSVVVVQVGFSTNLARLLSSVADSNSPLDGKTLVRRKVRLLSMMAGTFTAELAAQRRKEYNVVTDLASARKVIAEWPTPVVLSGWEIGTAIMHPGRGMQDDYGYVKHHPLVEAYGYYRGLKNDQPTYDLTSVLYAVRPDRGYFGLSSPGRVVVEDDGFTSFHPDPDGPHRYLTVNAQQVARVGEALALLCSQPPGK